MAPFSVIFLHNFPLVSYAPAHAQEADAAPEEEGAAGGFSAHVMQSLANSGGFDSGLKLRVLTMPDRFLDQEKPEIQNDIAGLTAPHIVANILSALGREEEALALLEARSA